MQCSNRSAALLNHRGHGEHGEDFFGRPLQHASNEGHIRSLRALGALRGEPKLRTERSKEKGVMQ